MRINRPAALAKPIILLPVMEDIQKAKVIVNKSRIDRDNKDIIKVTITTLIVRERVLTPCNLIRSSLVSRYSFNKALFALKKLIGTKPIKVNKNLVAALVLRDKMRIYE